MKKRHCLIISGVILFLVVAGVILRVLVAGGSLDAGQKSAFHEANHHFYEQRYDEAVKGYDGLLAEGVKGGGLHYNLGVSYQSLGNVGRSILHYERALLYSHYDADARERLEELRGADLSGGYVGFWGWGVVANSLSINDWVVVASLVGVLVMVLFLLGLVRVITLPNGLYVLLLLVLSLVVWMAFCAVQTQRERFVDKAIVVSDEAHVRVSPYDGAEKVGVIESGDMISLLPRQGHSQYHKVKLHTGKSGWLKVGSYERILE